MLVRQGHPPDLHILDNECSEDLRKAFLKYKIKFQNVPPHVHQVNAAERAIRTYKNHFITILCNTDSAFPMAEWDRLLAQATLTLNLLRSSRIHPSLSAHALLFGNFDFNRTPMAPPGTRIVAHENSDNRPSYGKHGKVGWYIGPSLDHYRCYKCYFEDTMMERDVDVLTVEFHPRGLPPANGRRYAPSAPTRQHFTTPCTPRIRTTHSQCLCKGSPNPWSSYTPTTDSSNSTHSYSRRRHSSCRNCHPRCHPCHHHDSESSASATMTPSPPPLRPVLQDITNQSAPVAAPRVPTPKSKAPFDGVPHRTRSKTRLRASPRFKSFYLRLNDQRSASMHRAQSIQHDPSVAGKMYNPTTGKLKTINSLLNGPDAARWNLSLTNEWGCCTRGLSKNCSAATIIIG
jgi:hypothetical protein